jgi:hypothetical protein
MPSYFRTLRFRLTLWFVGLLALMALAISAVVYFGFQQALLHNADDQLTIAAERSVKGMCSFPRPSRPRPPPLPMPPLAAGATKP